MTDAATNPLAAGAQPAPATRPLLPPAPNAPAAPGSAVAGSAATEGLLARGWHRLMGHRARSLRERAGHTSLMALLLILTQSATMILVFGHVELGSFLSGAASGSGGAALAALSVRVIMGIALAVLVINVYAADAGVIKTLARIPTLKRVRETGALIEHWAYVAFIIAVEGVTFGIVLVTLEQNPAALFSAAPILPNSPLILGALVALRVIAMCWTMLHLQIVAQPLPVLWETAMSRGREIVGGHTLGLLEQMGLTNRDAAEAMRVFGEMSRPPARRQTWWNKRLVARDEQYEQDARAQQDRVIGALQRLSHNADDVVAALKAELAAARNETEAAVLERLTGALMHLATRGELPEWLIEQRPDLAGFALPVGSGRSRRNGASKAAAREPQSRTEAQRQFLRDGLGIEPATAPGTRKGVWLRPADIRVLTDEGMGAADITKLLRFVGKDTKLGTGYAAPFDETMRELYQRNLLGIAARSWWEESPYSGLNASGISSESDGAEPGAAGDAAMQTGTDGGRVLAWKPR